MNSRIHTSTPAELQNQYPQSPFAKPFLLCIQNVRYEEASHQAPSVHGPDFYWRPSASGYFRSEDVSGWYIWDPGQLFRGESPLRLATVEEAGRCILHMSSTLIWDPERHGYIHAPIDCTTEALGSAVWRRLSFGQYGTSDLAILGHARAGYQLHLPGPDSWFEQLLPDVCKAQQDGQPTCKLAGHLSIIVGLLAFGVEPHLALHAINASFRRDFNSTRFQQHNLHPSPSKSIPMVSTRTVYSESYLSASTTAGHKKRSMVIHIAYDPTRVDHGDLQAWEQGSHGEMFS
ncbi:hypothetical protein AYL99_08488 [Fonsecaea erecta]|uniref:Uncharacterized protein n=1 Tax=Fonsecaea erecta TaxID=1367422 RepID=A0A178ZD68_9EURO|nr:hypothetical protein AYL99_08488 [Fonsecaea erecta]OAP57750.1 hypothetical protein AYL99_08488 [Fonsecaea erecta]